MANFGNKDVDISLLREFLVLGQVLNITEAAKHLNTTQTTLSKHLASLEKTLGVTLLERGNTTSKLTPEGKVFLESAHRVIEEYDKGLLLVRNVRKAQKNVVTVGGQYNHGAIRMYTSLMTDYRNRGEYLDIRLGQEVHVSVQEALNESTTDVLVFDRTDNLDLSGYEVIPLFRDPFLAILPADHPLANKKDLRLKDFADETIMLTVGSDTFENKNRMLQAFKEHNIQPDTELRVVKSSNDMFFMDTYMVVNFIPASSESFYPMLLDPAFHCRVVEDDCYFDYVIAYRKEKRNGFARQFAEELAKMPLPEGLLLPASATAK